MPSSGVKITGASNLRRLFRELPDRVATKVNRRAVNLATSPILSAVKAECPVEEGDLRRAQTKKVTNDGMMANGIVGADRDYVGENGQIPQKYDHLVVYGHITAEEKVVAPNPYIQRGWDESIDDAQAKYESELAAGIETEAMKLGGG